MSSKLIDTKIKYLIQICKSTQNYRKLTIVGFVLISNTLDEIGIKLGIRPRDKRSGEKLYKYMELINTVLYDNLKISFFQDELIDLVNLIEIQTIKRDFNIPIEYVKRLYNIYYDLRKLDVPNLHKSLIDEDYPNISNINFYSNFISGNRASDQKSTAFKTLILQKLKQKEQSIQKALNNEFNKNSFEKAIYLKKIRGSITKNGSDKISIKGQLKDNINYQKSVEDIVGYCFIGAFILFFLLGFVIIIETVIYTALTPTLSILILILFGPAALLLAIYWNYFHNEVIK